MHTCAEGLTCEGVLNVKTGWSQQISAGQRKHLHQKFLANFIHPMMAMSLGGGAWRSSPGCGMGHRGLVVNLINGLFSFWQEFRAEKAQTR